MLMMFVSLWLLAEQIRVFNVALKATLAISNMQKMSKSKSMVEEGSWFVCKLAHLW
jgi:hypothetical protein